MNIRKNLHQIWWQGEINIPKKYKIYRKSWFKNHAKWKYYLWDKHSFEKLLYRINNSFLIKIYNKLPLMIQKIDFAK